MKQIHSFGRNYAVRFSPDSMLLDISTAGIIARRARASFYRDFKAGRLTLIKVGTGTRIKVGDLRRPAVA